MIIMAALTSLKVEAKLVLNNDRANCTGLFGALIFKSNGFIPGNVSH